jgi:hypothetical protein
MILAARMADDVVPVVGADDWNVVVLEMSGLAGV